MGYYTLFLNCTIQINFSKIKKSKKNCTKKLKYIKNNKLGVGHKTLKKFRYEGRRWSITGR